MDDVTNGCRPIHEVEDSSTEHIKSDSVRVAFDRYPCRCRFVVNGVRSQYLTDHDLNWWAEARHIVEPSVAGEVDDVVRLRPVDVAEQEPVRGPRRPEELDQPPLLCFLEHFRALPQHVVFH